jgi:hypothetical protein
MLGCWSRRVLFAKCALATIALLFCAIALGQPKSQSRVVLLDGSTIAFESLQIQSDQVGGKGLPADLTLDDLQFIELRPPAEGTAPAKPSVIVDLRGRSRLPARAVTIANEKCKIEWSAGDALQVPIDLVRSMNFDPAATTSDFTKAQAAPSAELDRLFFKDESGKITSVTGLVDSLTPEQLSIELNGQKSTLPRSRLLGLVMAQPAAVDLPPPVHVAFTDGSTLGGQTIAIGPATTTLEFIAGGKAELPLGAIARIAIRSSRVAYLSEIKPLAEEQQAIVTLPRPWQRDKSVSGKTLTLGSRTFEKGIGVHARCLLTFAAQKKWDTLAATIGLDAAADGKGDCIFIVLADGQPLFERRMKGGDAAYQLQLPIPEREQVTLLVEPGEGLDLADHADWCDARFIKNR